MMDILKTVTCHKDTMLVFHRLLPDNMAGFDIRKIPASLWAHVYVLDLVDSRLRIHLAGTAIEDGLGRSIKDRYMEEFTHGPHSSHVLGAFHEAIELWTPFYLRQTVCLQNRPKLTIQASLQPLAGTGASCKCHIVGLMYVEYPPYSQTCAESEFSQQPLLLAA